MLKLQSCTLEWVNSHWLQCYVFICNWGETLYRSLETHTHNQDNLETQKEIGGGESPLLVKQEETDKQTQKFWP